MTSSISHSYRFSADIIRSLAIIGVVSIHVVLSIYNRPDFLGGTVWWISNVWNAISRASIPLFIMLSGYLLLPKKESSKKVFLRIRARLIVPLIFWFIWYRFWRQGYLSYQDMRPLSLLSSLFWADVGHLYFLVIMIGLYALLPLLRNFYMRLSPLSQRVSATFLLLGGMGLTLATYLSPIPLLNNFFFFWIPYLGFFVMGHVLGQLRVSKAARTLLLLIAGAMVLATALLGKVSMTQIAQGDKTLYPPGTLSQYFDAYLSPNVVIMSLSVFALLINCDCKLIQRSRTLRSVIQSISKASFGIYILHLMVIHIIEVTLGLGVDFVRIPLLLYVVVKFIVVLVGAYLFTRLLQRISFFRKTLGA